MGPQRMFDAPGVPGVQCSEDDFVSALKEQRASLWAAVDIGARILVPLLCHYCDLDLEAEIEEMRLALRDVLTVHLTKSIAGLEESAKNPYVPDVEELLSELASATLDCETIRRNMENLERGIEQMPQELRPIVEAGILPMISIQLSAAERRRDHLQEVADKISQSRPAAPDLALGAAAEETD